MGSVRGRPRQDLSRAIVKTLGYRLLMVCITVVVERGDETVFDREIQGYQSFQLTVYENETSRTQSVV